jgi:hypothetical protein
MFSVNEMKKLLDEQSLQVSIIPIDGRYIIQLDSIAIRGTLIIVDDIEEEELLEFSKTLHSMIQHMEVNSVDENNDGEVGQ